jgi:superfamily II RNA helicase
MNSLRLILALVGGIVFGNRDIPSCTNTGQDFNSVLQRNDNLRLRGGAVDSLKCLDQIKVRGVSHERAAALGDIARRAARQEKKRLAQNEDIDLELLRQQKCARRLELDISATSTGNVDSQPRCTPANDTVCSAEDSRVRHELSVKIVNTSSDKSIRLGPRKAAFEILDPVQDFDRAPFSPDILNTIRSLGFRKPSPIQAQCWPYLMAKYDVVAVASTGSGKTCGYVST